MTNMRHGLPGLSNPELNGLSRVFGAGWAVRLDQANGSIQPSLAIRSKPRGQAERFGMEESDRGAVFGKRPERVGRESGANGQAGR